MLDLPSMGAKANSIEHATQAHLQPRVDSNPQYEEFGQGVERIITQRQNGSITDPEAVERLTAVGNEILCFEEEMSKQGLSDASYAIYLTLSEEYYDTVPDEEIAELVASTTRDTKTIYRSGDSKIQIAGNGYQVQLPPAEDAGFEIGDRAGCHPAPRLLVIAIGDGPRGRDASRLAADLVEHRRAQIE